MQTLYSAMAIVAERSAGQARFSLRASVSIHFYLFYYNHARALIRLMPN